MSIAKSTGIIPADYEDHPDLFYEYLQGSAFIDKYRVPKSGPLDPVETAQSLDVELRYDLTELTGELSVVDGLIEGIAWEKGLKPIAIRIKPSAKDPLLTFAHEVGHYFLTVISGYTNYYSDQAVEDFCEYFANKLLEK